MVRRVLLLAWFLLFLAGEQVLAGTELFQQETSYGRPSYAETRTLETEDTHIDTAASFKGGLVTWEGSANQTAESATKVPAETTSNVRGLGRTKKVSRFSVSFKKLGVLCSVLLCAGLLTAAVKRRAALIEPDENKIREIEARLERLKALLPAAETLTLAVGSEESYSCFNTFREIVGKRDIAAEDARDVKTLETSFTRAFETLSRLHRVALEEADAILQADKSVPDFSLLGFPPEAAENALMGLEERSEDHATRPLIRTCRSLSGNGAALAARMQALAKRFSSQRPFENEEDEEVLLSTASALEVLRATSASRKRLTEAGQELGKAVFESVKLTFVGHHEQALLDLERGLQVMQLRFAIRRNAADASEGSGAAALSSADAERPFLEAMGKYISNAEALVAQLHLSAEQLRASPSLPVAAAIGKKMLDAEQQGQSLLKKCSEAAGSLSDLPSGVDDNSRLAALQMGISNAAFVQKEQARLTESLQRLREKMKNFWQEPPRSAVLNQFIAINSRANADAIAREAKKRAALTGKSVENLKEVEEVRAAVQELRATSLNCLFQSMDNRSLSAMEHEAQLLVFLEEDVSQYITQAGNVASLIARLPGRETPEYKELREKFNAAKEGVKQGQTLLAAADAAAEMRAHVLSMQRLLLSTSEGEQP